VLGCLLAYNNLMCSSRDIWCRHELYGMLVDMKMKTFYVTYNKVVKSLLRYNVNLRFVHIFSLSLHLLDKASGHNVLYYFSDKTFASHMTWWNIFIFVRYCLILNQKHQGCVGLQDISFSSVFWYMISVIIQ